MNVPFDLDLYLGIQPNTYSRYYLRVVVADLALVVEVPRLCCSALDDSEHMALDGGYIIPGHQIHPKYVRHRPHNLWAPCAFHVPAMLVGGGAVETGAGFAGGCVEPGARPADAVAEPPPEAVVSWLSSTAETLSLG